MRTTHWIAALALTTLSVTAGCAVDASGTPGGDTSSTASADRVVAASPATLGATGIVYYALDASGNWKAFGADGAVIASFDASSEAGKSVVRIDAHGRQVEIVYSIQTAGGVGIDGTVDGAPFSMSFPKNGGPIGGAPKNVDPALDAIFEGASRDLSANDRSAGPNTGFYRVAKMSAYCGGVWDAVSLATDAGDWFAARMLTFTALAANCPLA
jgi:hypothetical protein